MPRPMPAIPKRPWPARSVCRLSGRACYDGAITDGAWMGDGRREANVADIRAALELYSRADGLLIAIVFLLAALIAIV